VNRRGRLYEANARVIFDLPQTSPPCLTHITYTAEQAVKLELSGGYSATTLDLLDDRDDLLEERM
jgi:hypothetical protein